jgi:2-octaprenyl-6-methoxyphenol hydroxylase
MIHSRQYDIVIAGGGMVGTSLALALAPLGLRIAVVEAVAPGAALQPSFDDRSTALSRSSQRFFQALGLWPAVARAATPIMKIHVSDQGRFGFSHIEAAQQGVEALGYIVINRVLGTVLQAALGDCKDIELYRPARIVDVRQGDNSMTAVLADGSERQRVLACRLLVAADGTNSSVRELLGISAIQQSYEQQAVLGNVLPDKPMNNVASVRVTRTGPLALLPVADNRAAFVWNLRQYDAERVLQLDDAECLVHLQAAFGYRLGEFSHIGKRVAYPLSLSKAQRLVAPRSVLVGNAAHGLHPVAAQGFNLGLRDVAALSDCIADAQELAPDAPDPGAPAVLERYSAWRRDDQRKLVRFTDGLVKLFGSERASLRILRDIGMLGFDLLPGVRSEFARQTMGLAGRLPRLSRGAPLR